MTTERSGERQDSFCRLGRFIVNPLGMSVLHLALERPRASGSAGHSHAIRRLVREYERHLEKRRQRQSAPGQVPHEHVDGPGDDDDRSPPDDEAYR